MAKEHISPQSRLRKLIHGGRVSFISIDTSINSCGICAGIIKKNIGDSTIYITVHMATDINSTASDKLLDDDRRIRFMSEKIISTIKGSDANLILIEDPEKSVVYGAKKGGLNYSLRRAGSVCIVKCINYFIKGYFKAERSKSLIITVKPSDWQCKKEIKKCKDSKDWSTGKALDLLTDNIFGTPEIEVSNRSLFVPKLITEHSADAFLMMYELTKKAITEKN
jgi:hypothetical protein